jgi:hypothetical protein
LTLCTHQLSLIHAKEDGTPTTGAERCSRRTVHRAVAARSGAGGQKGDTQIRAGPIRLASGSAGGGGTERLAPGVDEKSMLPRPWSEGGGGPFSGGVITIRLARKIWRFRKSSSPALRVGTNEAFQGCGRCGGHSGCSRSCLPVALVRVTPSALLRLIYVSARAMMIQTQPRNVINRGIHLWRFTVFRGDSGRLIRGETGVG